MSEYTVKISTTAKEKAFLSFTEALGITAIKNPNTITKNAIEDARKGKVIKVKSSKELIKELTK